MANIDRLINWEQGERICDALESLVDLKKDVDVSWGGADADTLAWLIEKSDKGEIDLAEDCGWRVGDTRLVQFTDFASSVSYGNQAPTSQLMPMTIMDTNHYDLVTPTEGGKTKSTFVIGCNPVFRSEYVSGSSYTSSLANTKYSGKSSSISTTGSYIAAAIGWVTDGTWRDICNNQFYAAMEPKIAKHFKKFYVNSGNSENNTVTKTADLFVLPSAKEVLGTDAPYATSLVSGTSSVSISKAEYDATSQLEWYKSAPNRAKVVNQYGSMASNKIYMGNYWLRSVVYGYYDQVNGSNTYKTRYALGINNNGALAANNSINTYHSISPMGVI